MKDLKQTIESVLVQRSSTGARTIGHEMFSVRIHTRSLTYRPTKTSIDTPADADYMFSLQPKS